MLAYPVLDYDNLSSIYHDDKILLVFTSRIKCETREDRNNYNWVNFPKPISNLNGNCKSDLCKPTHEQEDKFIGESVVRDLF